VSLTKRRNKLALYLTIKIKQNTEFLKFTHGEQGYICVVVSVRVIKVKAVIKWL